MAGLLAVPCPAGSRGRLGEGDLARGQRPPRL